MQRRSWTTNKAEFEWDGREVRKRYFRSGDACRDHALLERISAGFATATIEGWSYRALQVLGADCQHNQISMEYVDGDDLGSLFGRTRDPSLFAHAGRWLGALHRGTRSTDGTVLAFNDYNRTNVILDTANKVVVAIDPGWYTDLRVHPSQSLVMGSFSIVRVALRYLMPPHSLLRSFLSGYLVGAERGELPTIDPGIRYLFGRFRAGRSHAPIRRPAALRTPSGAIECLVLAAAMRQASARRFFGRT